MARTRIIYSSVTGKKLVEFKDGAIVWASDEYQGVQSPDAPMVMNDLAPYQSMIDGSMITSRSQHRAHLKQHGCIEVGNEAKHLKAKPMAPTDSGRKETIARAVYEKLRY